MIWPFGVRSAANAVPPKPAPPTLALRPLQFLVAGSVIVPIIIFLIASWIAYDRQFDDARDRLQRDRSRIYEHALKVFETFELSERYLEEIFDGLSDSEIRAREQEFSTRLRNTAATLPQLRDLWVIGANGHPLVAGTVFPMPDIDLSDRKYFSAHKNDEVRGVYVDEVVDARAANTRFFAITKRRETEDGKFNGVYLVSIAPEYFVKYYAELPQSSIYALLRADGAILARYPESSSTRAPPNAALMQAIKDNPSIGIIQAASVFDRTERLVAYRKLPRLPVYVLTATDYSTIRADWMKYMASHLVFGLPATMAMFALGLVALRRMRQEASAYGQLRQEVALREQTEMALHQAQKMEAVGRLTGGIAHDFNNLLTAILGNIDLVAKRFADGDERTRRQLGAARQASERAAALVHRLLAFSRQHPLEVKAVDINRLVQGMSELLRRTIGETVEIETVLAAGLWKAAVDPNQLENAILNLAVNARDAMPSGGRLTIETVNSHLDEAYAASQGEELAHGQYVLLAVSDSGSGMSKDIRERAFEPFFTTKPTGVGSGLGLSMVYGFVKQSGGFIKIYSEIGEGSTFKLYFPRITEQTALASWPEAQKIPAASNPMGNRNETILLVEDDEDVNRFATEVLREQGYNVISALEAVNALRLLEAKPDISLLFTDVVLPGSMNGRQLADEARKRRPELKVLFATGYTRNAIIHQGRLDPDVDLLSKPFTPDVLARKIRQVLDA
jgi:two-component system NtrC family sensor kinase